MLSSLSWLWSPGEASLRLRMISCVGLKVCRYYVSELQSKDCAAAGPSGHAGFVMIKKRSLQHVQLSIDASACFAPMLLGS